MTFETFRALHPDLIQYDRAGIAGIDFEKLHNRIQGSRYLREKKSFIYITKNYNKILRGDFEDFPESEKTRAIREQAERVKIRENNIRQMIANLKSVKKHCPNIEKMKEETGVIPDDAIEDLRLALMSADNESAERSGRDFYNRIMMYV